MHDEESWATWGQRFGWHLVEARERGAFFQIRGATTETGFDVIEVTDAMRRDIDRVMTPR